MTDDNISPNYYLIACGTSDYESDAYPALPEVPDDLKRISEVFCGQYGYERLFEPLSLNGNKQDLIDAFQNWLLSDERTALDHVVFYYSGHGEFDNDNQHYLILEKTDPRVLSTATSLSGLRTTSLLSLFSPESIKVCQVLFIIDTCYSGLGAGNISQYASKVIDRLQPMNGPNLSVASISASRGSQIAKEGVFSKTMVSVLQQWQMQDPCDFLSLGTLVERMNDENPDPQKQVFEHNINKQSHNPRFFQRTLPLAFRTWESQREQHVQELIHLLETWDNAEVSNGEEQGLPMYWLNTYFLLRNRRQRYISSWTQWKNELQQLSQQAVSKGICDLYAYAEWCISLLTHCSPSSPTQLVSALEAWQSQLRNYRPQIQVDAVYDWTKAALEQWTEHLQKDEHRLLITIKPEQFGDDNLGETPNLLLTTQLWMSQDSRPLFRSINNQVLKLKPFINQTSDPLTGLCECLSQDSHVIHVIRTTRELFPATTSFPSKLKVEIYVPRQYFSAPLEDLSFERDDHPCFLGSEYVITLNSYSRYFDKEFRECNEDVSLKKQKLWPKEDRIPLTHTALKICENPTDDLQNYYQFDDDHLYVGTSPSDGITKKIERSLPIAIWSRDPEQAIELGQDFSIEDWFDFPEQVRQFRRKNRGKPITLLWDDTFPKPQEFAKDLNSSPS